MKRLMTIAQLAALGAALVMGSVAMADSRLGRGDNRLHPADARHGDRSSDNRSGREHRDRPQLRNEHRDNRRWDGQRGNSRPDSNRDWRRDDRRRDDWRGDVRRGDDRRRDDWRDRNNSRMVPRYGYYRDSAPRYNSYYYGGRYDGPRYRAGRYNPPRGYYYRQWRRGQYLPYAYRHSGYYVNDYYRYGLYAPPRGHCWVRYGNDILLTALATGLVLDAIYDFYYY
ncbi:MAG: RcnB family protein [Steroidobacteraceae bacterium]